MRRLLVCGLLALAASGCVVERDLDPSHFGCGNGGGCVCATDLDCNDGNGCTSDLCDIDLGCTHVGNGSSCDDNNPCTGAGMCSGATCKVGGPVNCNDNNICTKDSCSVAVGCTSVKSNEGCNDGDPCTVDKCETSCSHAPLVGSCDDGNPCTVNETCVGGTCSGGALDCDDGDKCTDDTCQASGGCQHTPRTCDDGNPCTLDSCSKPSGQCDHPAKQGNLSQYCPSVPAGCGECISPVYSCASATVCPDGQCYICTPGYTPNCTTQKCL